MFELVLVGRVHVSKSQKLLLILVFQEISKPVVAHGCCNLNQYATSMGKSDQRVFPFLIWWCSLVCWKNLSLTHKDWLPTKKGIWTCFPRSNLLNSPFLRKKHTNLTKAQRKAKENSFPQKNFSEPPLYEDAFQDAQAAHHCSTKMLKQLRKTKENPEENIPQKTCRFPKRLSLSTPDNPNYW